jgi:hypothetical protein
MSMLDFQSALAGGGPPPPDMGGGPPPDMGMGAPPPDVGAPPPPPEAGGGEYGTSLEALDAAEDALHSFIQIDPDEADRAEATKALQIVIKLKASNQDSATSGDLSGLQRALQGGPAATAGPMGAGLAA